MRYYGVDRVDGILADLGVSFHHFDDSDRGFSFRFEGPLDMRMNRRSGQTAAQLIATCSEEKLADLFFLYGELKSARRIAAAVVAARSSAPIETTERLLEVVRPDVYKRQVIAPVDKDEASIEYFSNHILEICSARNANVSLNEATKSNKEGLYEDLKRCLKGSYRENIAWRSGEPGTIKCDDIVALACLPLIKLHECGYFDGNPNIGVLNRIAIYSQKSLCVKYYRNLMKDKSVSEQQLGKYDLTDNAIRSGFELVDDIVRFFDKIYYHFPMVYNRNSGSFGRITGVVQKENETGGYISKFTGPFNTYPKRSIYNLSLIHI